MWGYGHSGAVWELQGPKGADLLGFRRGSVRLHFGGLQSRDGRGVGSDWRVAQVRAASWTPASTGRAAPTIKEQVPNFQSHALMSLMLGCLEFVRAQG